LVEVHVFRVVDAKRIDGEEKSRIERNGGRLLFCVGLLGYFFGGSEE
jgi:hypothetical protein